MRAAAYVCPTMNRQELHPELHATFSAQTLTRKGLARLYVLDESPRPSSYFSRIKDAAVTYVHRVAIPRIDGVTRIGESRNAINALVREPYVLHTDDDDWMDPSYGEQLLERLGDAALAKLDVWRCWTEAIGDDVIFEWDTRKPVGGEHWALRGDDVEKTVVDPNEMPADVAARTNDAWRVGFGFSYCYPISSWRRHKFPVEGTEDIAFARAIRESGGKIVFISDLAHLILHRVSARSLSVHFPQRIVEGAQKMLGAAGAPEQQLRAWLSQRMMGAGASMNPLPDGKAIHVIPGQTYAVLAAIKNAHSLRSLSTRASQWGVTVSEARDNVSPAEFGVQPAPSGYRLVHAIASSSRPGVLPWKVPAPISVFDKTHIVKAWTSAPIGAGAVMESGMQLVTGAARHSSTLGPKGDEFVGAAVERYDPKRYAGKAPPHVCTAASATAIAQQLPGAPWVYAGTVASTAGMRETISAVTTPMGKKNIPVWHASDGAVVTQCPYSGQRFLFRQPTVGAGFCTMCQQPAPCNTPSCCKVRGDFFPRDRGPYREPDPALLLAGNIEYERETQTGAGKIPDRIQLTTGETIQNDCGPSNLAAMGSRPEEENMENANVGAGGGDSGLCGANGSVADPAWSVCKWVQSGGDTSASQVSLGAAVDARRAYWLGVWRPLYQSGGCGNGYIKPQVETINGTQWLFSFSGYPADIYVAAFHCPCPQGQYFNGNACIKQVVFQQPPTSQPAAPIHVDHAMGLITRHQ